MKTILTFILALFLGFGAINSQELIIESDDSVPVFNSETFQTENTKIYVELGNVFIRWNEDGTDGIFQFTATLKTASGTTITTHSLSKPVSVLDLTNQSISVHTYLRDQIYNAVTNVDPFGLTVWNKLY